MKNEQEHHKREQAERVEFDRLGSRGKNILEHLSRPRFLPGFEISRNFVRAIQVKKKREISKPGKNRGLESCSNIFFPLKHT